VTLSARTKAELATSKDKTATQRKTVNEIFLGRETVYRNPPPDPFEAFRALLGNFSALEDPRGPLRRIRRLRRTPHPSSDRVTETTGAPHLARFSRDVGYHSPTSETLNQPLIPEGNRTGAPRSPRRTWAEKDGRSPSIAFQSRAEQV
jgi:hypothetical protein